MAPQHEERRLITILAADVVGYSRLMAADEAGTFARLKADRKELIEPKTAEYHGRVVKLTGDGTLMEFGSVVDAVLFVVDVQRAMIERDAVISEDRRIRYRVGINIGEIIVDDEDIYGDGVNIAARIEELAEPGSVYVSRSVYNQIKGKVGLGFEEAGSDIQEALRINPRFNLTRAASFYPTSNPESLERFVGGLRRAGLPEWRFTLAEMGSGSSKTTGEIPLAFADGYAQFSEMHVTESGIVRWANTSGPRPRPGSHT